MTKTIILTTTMLAVLMTATSVGFGQDETSELKSPRNTVKNAAARRPGLWINSATATYTERHNKMLGEYGGATPTPEDQIPPSRTYTMKIAFLEGVFDFIINLVEQYQLAIQAARAAQSASAGT